MKGEFAALAELGSLTPEELNYDRFVHLITPRVNDPGWRSFKL